MGRRWQRRRPPRVTLGAGMRLIPPTAVFAYRPGPPMQDVFSPLTPADYAFLIGLIESPFTLTDDAALKRLLAAYEADPSEATREELDLRLEREIRYLGSADLAYVTRMLSGQTPGVTFREIIGDVARTLKVELPRLGTDRELLEDLVEQYATQQFARLTPEEQQRMLVDLGVDKDKAARFVLKSAGVFSLPLLIAAFDAIIVQGLIKTIIFGTIAKLIGRQLSSRLFSLLAGRLPWWVSWIGPAAWTISIGWTALDLQAPAQRKVIPIVLFLGLCSLRERQGSR
jgi:uncharacterized protein YaaW (UPF0174 family)